MSRAGGDRRQCRQSEHSPHAANPKSVEDAGMPHSERRARENAVTAESTSPSAHPDSSDRRTNSTFYDTNVREIRRRSLLDERAVIILTQTTDQSFSSATGPEGSPAAGCLRIRWRRARRHLLRRWKRGRRQPYDDADRTIGGRRAPVGRLFDRGRCCKPAARNRLCLNNDPTAPAPDETARD